jgi:hypothetical protein
MMALGKPSNAIASAATTATQAYMTASANK